MLLFELTLALLLGSVVIAGLARRLAAPYPAFLAVAGAGLAFLPHAPVVEIEPDLALALFIAPVLLDAAFDTSPRDLKRYAAPIFSLALVAVILTTAAVAYVGAKLVGLPVAAAIALGAIVAPPDAVAAATVLNQLKPPRRIMAILQSESLLNDAGALLIYRAAVAAATGPLVLATAGPLFLLSAAGSVVFGYIVAWFMRRVFPLVSDPASTNVLQFVTVFAVWIVADRIGLSAIIAVVVLAFVLMGLQARPILSRLADDKQGDAFALAAAALATAIAVRLVWVLASGAAMRGYRRSRGAESGGDARSDLLIGWCGMRGLVTVG